MTILEALTAQAKYPLKPNFYQYILIKRGLAAGEEFTHEVATGRQFELARADVLIGLVDAVQLQEGNMQINITDKSNFIKLANAIYARYDEPLYGDENAPEPSVQFLSDLC